MVCLSTVGKKSELQDYRLEGVEAEVGTDGRLSARGWLSLALPALLVAP